MYSLEELNRIFEAKRYLNLERFVHYFTHRFGYTKRSATEAYKIFREFPIHDPRQREDLDAIIPLALLAVDDIQNMWTKKPKNIRTNYPSLFYKIIYRDNEQIIKEIIIDLPEFDDIITYAEILKRDVEIIALLEWVATFYYDNKDQHAFDGDFYDSFDHFWGDKSNVYLASAKEKCFKRLIYIKGIGYLLNDEPIIDEGQFNSHALTLNKFTKLGNIYTDLEKLKG